MTIVKRKLKTKGVSYQVRLRDPSGRRWMPSKAFCTRADAEDYENELLREREGGISSEVARKRQVTFGEYFRIWAKTRNGSTHSVGWMKAQDQMARTYVLPTLRRCQLKRVGRLEVEQILTAMEKKGLAQSTRRLVFNLMHAIFAHAVRAGILGVNPLPVDLKPRVARTIRPHLTPRQARELLRHALHSRVGTAVWLGTLAGLRCEAIQALRWRNIDFEKSQILIRETFKRNANCFGPPKGKHEDYVPMGRALAEYLRPLSEGKFPTDFVASVIPGRMLGHHMFIDGLTKLCREAGLPRVTPHGLRHTCTELFIEQGASLEDVRRLLNHKDGRTVLTYVHRTPERLIRIANRVPNPVEYQENEDAPLAVGSLAV